MVKKSIFMKFAPLSAAVLLLSGIASCTIKEERADCPAWLTVASKIVIPEEIRGVLSLFFYQDGKQEIHLEYPVENFRQGVDVAIPRGELEVAGIVGWPDENISGDVLRIPYGEHCPQAWGFYEYMQVADDAEEVSLGMALRPLFARMYICITGADEDYPYGLVVEGDVDGYLLASLELHHGPFLYVPDLLDKEEFDEVVNPIPGLIRESNYEDRACRVPRQDDRNLTVSLVRTLPSFGTKAEGDELDYVYTLPLGDILDREGYDWSSDTLDDIDVLIDFAATRVCITVDDWTKVLLMDGKYVI